MKIKSKEFAYLAEYNKRQKIEDETEEKVMPIVASTDKNGLNYGYYTDSSEMENKILVFG